MTERKQEQTEPVMRVSELSMHYAGQDAVWENLSFAIYAGEALGLTGRNGVGKSTLIRILAGMMRPDDGTLIFHDSVLYQGGWSRTVKRDYQSVLGYVPQEIVLYPELSGYENLLFFGRANHVTGKLLQQRITEVTESIRLDESMLRKKVKHCSGGMKRRLNLAASLLHNPQILLLDEPVTGIDEESEAVILQELCRRKDAGASMIYIGHDRTELSTVCTRVLQLTRNGLCVPTE